MDTEKKFSVKKAIKLIICGALVGGGAILPGISGGVLCVIFGVYKPMMDFLADPFHECKKMYKGLIVFSLGWVIGFWGFSRLIEMLFELSEIYTTWGFIGLIAGTFPALFKEAGKEGRNRYSWIAFALAFVLMAGGQMLTKTDIFPTVVPGFGWFLFCGALWGMSIVVPGMTSSSILMGLNLFEPLNEGISNLDLYVLFPWVLGLVVVVILVTKFVARMFEKHYSVFYHIVLGIVFASTVMIIPLSYSGGKQVIGSLVFAALGVAVSFLFTKFEPE